MKIFTLVDNRFIYLKFILLDLKFPIIFNTSFFTHSSKTFAQYYMMTKRRHAKV